MIQKLLDADYISQNKIKQENKHKSKEKPVNVNSMTDLLRDAQIKMLKAKGQAKLDSNLGFKDEKRLELNTSFELEYTNSDEFRDAENAFINFKDYESRTALHAAVLKGNDEAIKILLYNRASLFIRDRKLNV